MSSLPIISAFNDGYVAELYEAYRRDPASVDESWRQLFRFAATLAVAPGGGAAPSADPAYLRKVAGAAALLQAIRQYGHLDVTLDPLGSPPMGAAELRPEFHGISESDLATIPGQALGFPEGTTAADAVAHLRQRYSSTMGFEFEHIGDESERDWFRTMIEGDEMRRTLSTEEKLAVLRRLTQVDGLERFLGRVYLGYKRFSIEGTDVLVPMIDAALEQVAELGMREVVIGMAHRGRINVLAHILDKPYEVVFGEFEGKHAMTNAASGTGDVKYHLGATSEHRLARGGTIAVRLMPNPSHLEFVNPVLEGAARALQQRSTPSGETLRASGVLPILVHGDAAFPGEGVVAETLNLSQLRGYATGGTLHVIANNQLGFTTDPRDGRSTYYASDLAKGFEIPIVHVNADDAESCIAAVWLGVAYRMRFGKDFLIDVVGYRRHGHNETDEPSFTQPLLYAKVRSHPTPVQLWAQRLEREGVATAEDAQRIDAEVQGIFERAHKAVAAAEDTAEPAAAAPRTPVETAVSAEQLIALNERLLVWPTDFHPLPKQARQFERRRSGLQEGGIDWGHAEALAFASLLAHGIPVRLTGQDVERGTFSHRQAVLHDHETGGTYTPLAHVGAPGVTFEIYNSPLSETAALGFEYGYSVTWPDALVLWEAQFGDFANVAQPIIDQYLAADRAKWGQDSSLVLLLPHGYEGQGPEHSSARLERFLQLCAEGNMEVAYPSTPAQYFHVLRAQAMSVTRRPLVLMQPKSLLRLPAAASRLEDLTAGRFRTVIDDPRMETAGRGADGESAAPRRETVRRVVLCSGKLYYDLIAAEPGSQVALVRVERLYPWPHEELSAVLDGYPGAEEIVWAQEEPRNMGAWTFAAPRLRAVVGNTIPIRYVGRPERASPAEGYKAAHDAEQARIVSDALQPAAEPREKRRAARAAR
ncbi:MAG TPA: 2-oxoglutarate dehydrogenase E1 component [Gemmatimonadaceae bacterium]|nr:2-oxoglutarate dehydrogenase E1 component [Gemmatimonadaceae bacterium]